jgi:hypothetical protein
MPSIMDAPELVKYGETLDLVIETTERPRPARAGFWRTLAHALTKHLAPTPRAQYVPSCSAPRTFETPADLLARQHPTLYLRALCGV